MKKLIALTATLAVSTATFAATVGGDRDVFTEGYGSEAQAYDAGFDLLEEYKEMSSLELQSTLGINAPGIELKGGTVVVEEFAQNRGEIQYRAIVDLDYVYQSTN